VAQAQATRRPARALRWVVPLARLLWPCYEVLAVLHALASEVGLVAAPGPARHSKLALF